ncbi:MAG: hypothetical protein KBS62_02130 [Oscillospiraceae bacterium]|nr:hypothetical protein [Candidatus Ruminococcus equi]
MKQCDYCAKEISYHEMYCCDECQKKTIDFYDLRDKYSKVFSIFNGIFVLSIGIGIFAYSFLPTFGAFLIAVSLLVLSVLYFLFPFPPEIMIHKRKLEKSIKFCRIVSLVLFILGILATVFAIFTIFM